MRIIINDGTDHTVGCVNLTNLECSHAGGVESKYGQDVGAPIKPWNRHSIGMERCRFTVQRWYKADTDGDTNLLYDLHNNDTVFDLSESLSCIIGFSGLKLVGCQSYQYHALTDSANDVAGEEIIGEGMVWEEDVTPVKWLNNSWLYRKCHDINSAVDAGVDYQVQITVHYGTGTDSLGDVYCNSHCKTDFGDIRFTSSDGTTELDYWMMSKTNSDNAVFWVEVKDSLDSNVTIYLYYGNPSATTTSDFDDTFIFGDPFDNTVLNTSRWTSVDSAVSYIVDVAGGHRLVIRWVDDNNWWINTGFHSRKIVFPTSYIVEDAYSSNGQAIVFSPEWAYDYFGAALTIRDSSSMVARGGFSENWGYNYYVLFADVGGTNWTSAQIHTTWGTYTTLKAKIWKLGNMHVEIDGVVRVDDVSNFVPDRITLELAKTQIETSIFGTVYFYAFKIRKYVSPEPVHNSWCDEETT